MPPAINPSYIDTAHRHAIVLELIDLLREDYLALSAEKKPRKTIVCEEVFREDSTVSEKSIGDVIDELEREAEALRLDLRKFQFGKVSEEHGLLSTHSKATEATPGESSSAHGEETPGAAEQSKRRRRGRRR